MFSQVEKFFDKKNPYRLDRGERDLVMSSEQMNVHGFSEL